MNELEKIFDDILSEKREAIEANKKWSADIADRLSFLTKYDLMILSAEEVIITDKTFGGIEIHLSKNDTNSKMVYVSTEQREIKHNLGEMIWEDLLDLVIIAFNIK